MSLLTDVLFSFFVLVFPFLYFVYFSLCCFMRLETIHMFSFYSTENVFVFDMNVVYALLASSNCNREKLFR